MTVALAFGLSACATIRTMPSMYDYGTPKVYSGTRLDIQALMDGGSGLAKFKAQPPEYPLIDFPFSLIADTILLPITYPMGMYEFFFE